MRWFAQEGETAVRTAALVFPPEGRSLALELRQARLEAERRAGRTGTPEDDDATARVRRLEARAAEHRGLSLAGPTLAFDPSSLLLAEDEAVLIIAPVGPGRLVGIVARGGHPLEAQVVPATRADLRRAVRAWRDGAGRRRPGPGARRAGRPGWPARPRPRAGSGRRGPPRPWDGDRRPERSSTTS